MDDAGSVRAGEPLRQLAGDVEHLAGLERMLGADQVAQGRAIDELHDGEGQPCRLADLVDRDDVRVVQRGGRACLLGESTEAVGDGGEGLRQELDRDIAAEVEVPRAVHLTHAPRTQLVEELVPAEPHADQGWHGRSMMSRRLRLRSVERRGQGVFELLPRQGKRTGATVSPVAPVPVFGVMPCLWRGTAGGPAAPRRGAWPGMPVEGSLASPVGPWTFRMAGHRPPFHPSRLPPI